MLKFHRDLSHMKKYFKGLHSVYLTYIDRSVNNNLDNEELLNLAKKMQKTASYSFGELRFSIESLEQLETFDRQQLLDYIDSHVNHAYYIHNIEIYLM